MSDAVYNEVIALVARTEQFEASIEDVKHFWASTVDKIASTPLQLPVRFDQEAVLGIDQYLDRQRAEIDQVRSLNDLYKERVRVLKEAEDIARGPAPGVDVTTGNASRGERYDLKQRILSATASDADTATMRAQLVEMEKVHRLAAEREVREIALQSAKMVGEATRKNDADRLARQQAVRAEELAALKADIIAREKANVDAFANSVHNEDQLKTAEKVRVEREDARIRKEEAARVAQATTDAHNATQLAKLKTNAEADTAAKRTRQAAIDKANLASQLHQRETADTVAAKMSQYRMSNELSVAIEIAARRKVIAQYETDEAHRREAIEKRLASVKSTTGYKVGSTIAGGKVGAGFDIAAGGAFALGATNLGGTIYMAERAAYALGIGQKTLGEFAEKLGLVQTTGEGAAASMAVFGRAVVGVGAGIAAVGAAVGVMVLGSKMDTALAEMSTLLADTTVKGKDFTNMMDDAANSAIRLSNSFNVDVVEVINGFKTALSTGIDASDLETFGRDAMIVAKGLGTSFDDSVSILTSFKDAYGASVSDMSHYSDVLFNAINVGKFQVNDLRSNIGRVLTSAAEAGVGVEDMMGALAALTRVGMTTSQAITSLNSMIVGVVNPTETAQKAFDKLGISTGSAAFKAKGFLQYYKELRDVVGDNADVFGDLFGEERARRGAIAYTANLALAKSTREEVTKVGTAAIAANRAMDTFGTNIGKVWNSIINPIKSAGETMLTVLNNVIFAGNEIPVTVSTGSASIVDLGITAVDSTAKLTTAFDELNKAIVRAGEAGETAFDKMINKQRDYYKQVVRADAYTSFDADPTNRPTYAAGGEVESALAAKRVQETLNNAKYIAQLREQGWSEATIAKAIAPYEAEMAVLDAKLAKLREVRNEINAGRKEAYEQRRELAALDALEAKGYDVTAERAAIKKVQASKEQLPEDRAASVEADTTARKHNVAILDQQFDVLSKITDKLAGARNMSALTTQTELAGYSSTLTAAKAKYDKIRAILDDTENLTTEQRKTYTDLANAYLTEIETVEKKLTLLQASRYKREYEAAEAAYNKKMAFYNKEEDKINSIIKKIMDQKNALQQSIADRTANLRGPDYARRQYRDQIEVGTRNAANIADPLQQAEAIEKLRDLITKFVSASDASGNGARGAREASDMEALLIKLDERMLARQKEAWKNNEGLKQTAGMVRNQAEADNPIAHAVRAEAQKVIKDTLSEAAKYGMTISGDYKVDIDKINVEVKGLERATVEKMIETAVINGIKSDIRKRENGDVNAGNGLAPVGTTTDWSKP